MSKIYKLVFLNSALLVFFVYPVFAQQAATTENKDSSRAAFQRYVAEFSKDYTNEDLRKKIIEIAVNLDPVPVVPEDAKKAMVWGKLAFKDAKTPADLEKAVDEFIKAISLAPWSREAYFNLALVREKQGDYARAINNFKYYLMASVFAPDAQAVQEKIYELEYKMQKQESVPASGGLNTAIKPEDLTGSWHEPGNNNVSYEIEYKNGFLVVSTINLNNRPDLQIYRGEKNTAYSLTMDDRRQLSGPPPSGPFGRVTGSVSEDGRQIEIRYPSLDNRMTDGMHTLVKD